MTDNETDWYRAHKEQRGGDFTPKYTAVGVSPEDDEWEEAKAQHIEWVKQNMPDYYNANYKKGER